MKIVRFRNSIHALLLTLLAGFPAGTTLLAAEDGEAGSALALETCELLVPGTPSLIEGSAVRGALRLLTLAAGLAAWLAALAVPAPPELGRLATLLPALAALSLLGPLYGSSWRESARRVRNARGMA